MSNELEKEFIHALKTRNMVKLRNILFDGEANINCGDAYNKRALHFAIETGEVDLAYLLLDLNADINLKDNDDWSALHFAAFNGHAGIILKVLKLNRGILVNDRDKIGRTALHFAAWKGHEIAIETLIKQGAELNVIDDEGNTPLHLATTFRQVSAVKLLLTCGVNINATDKFNQTALHIAVHDGNEAMIVILLHHQINVDVLDRDYCTSLHIAIQKGFESIVRMLLNHGTNLLLKAKIAFPTLQYAILCRKETIALLLVDFLIDSLEEENNDGQTALHSAIEFGMHDVVIKLLHNGANANAVDKNNKTPLHFLGEYGHNQLVAVLVQHGAKLNELDNDSFVFLRSGLILKKDNIEHAREETEDLYEYKEIDEYKYEKGFTALHYACLYGHEEVVTELIQEGANTECESQYYRTALHCALERGFKNIVIYLLDHHANINAKTKMKRTPLHFAVLTNNIPMVSILLAHGARGDIVDKNAFMPLDYAIENKFFEIIDMFISHKVIFGDQDMRAFRLSLLEDQYSLFMQLLQFNHLLIIQHRKQVGGMFPFFQAVKSMNMRPVVRRMSRLIEYAYSGVQERNTVNIHLIGDGKAGKSVTMKWFLDILKPKLGDSVKYKLNKHATHHIDVTYGRTRGVKITSFYQKEHNQHYVIHDYGGQEEFMISQANYLRKENSIYVLLIPLCRVLDEEDLILEIKKLGIESSIKEKVQDGDKAEDEPTNPELSSRKQQYQKRDMKEIVDRYEYWLKLLYSVVNKRNGLATMVAVDTLLESKGQSSSSTEGINEHTKVPVSHIEESIPLLIAVNKFSDKVQWSEEELAKLIALLERKMLDSFTVTDAQSVSTINTVPSDFLCLTKTPIPFDSVIRSNSKQLLKILYEFVTQTSRAVIVHNLTVADQVIEAGVYDDSDEEIEKMSKVSSSDSTAFVANSSSESELEYFHKSQLIYGVINKLEQTVATADNQTASVSTSIPLFMNEDEFCSIYLENWIRSILLSASKPKVQVSFRMLSNDEKKTVLSILCQLSLQYLYASKKLFKLSKPVHHCDMVTDPLGLTSCILGDLLYWYHKCCPSQAKLDKRVTQFNDRQILSRLHQVHNLRFEEEEHDKSSMQSHCATTRSSMNHKIYFPRVRSSIDAFRAKYSTKVSTIHDGDYGNSAIQLLSTIGEKISLSEIYIGMGLCLPQTITVTIEDECDDDNESNNKLQIERIQTCWLIDLTPSLPKDRTLSCNPSAQRVVSRYFFLKQQKTMFIPGYFTRLFHFLHNLQPDLKFEVWKNAIHCIIEVLQKETSTQYTKEIIIQPCYDKGSSDDGYTTGFEIQIAITEHTGKLRNTVSSSGKETIKLEQPHDQEGGLLWDDMNYLRTFLSCHMWGIEVNEYCLCSDQSVQESSRFTLVSDELQRICGICSGEKVEQNSRYTLKNLPIEQLQRLFGTCPLLSEQNIREYFTQLPVVFLPNSSFYTTKIHRYCEHYNISRKAVRTKEDILQILRYIDISISQQNAKKNHEQKPETVKKRMLFFLLQLWCENHESMVKNAVNSIPKEDSHRQNWTLCSVTLSEFYALIRKNRMIHFHEEEVTLTDE